MPDMFQTGVDHILKAIDEQSDQILSVAGFISENVTLIGEPMTRKKTPRARVGVRGSRVERIRKIRRRGGGGGAGGGGREGFSGN